MSLGTSNRVALRVVEESTWGVTPTSPALEALRFNSESLNFNADFTTSEEIRADRMTSDTVMVSASGSGDIESELSFGTFDKLFAGAMFNNWVTAGSIVAAATDIALVRTPGSPVTWSLTSGATDMAAQSWSVGQYVLVAGFADPFFAEIVSIAAGALGIRPLTDVPSDSAGDPITITPLNFVRNGTTPKSFTVQKAFTDLAVQELLNFQGSRVGSLAFDISTGSIITLSMSMMAKDALMTETQFSGASVTAANSNEVMNAVTNISGITFDGDPSGTELFFNTLSISIDNQLRGQEAVGTLGYIGIQPGRLALTGSIELYFSNSAVYDKFRASGTFALSFLARDNAGNAYVVSIPRAKYTALEITAGGLDQDIFAAAEFEALINTAGTYQVQISRLTA
jgi:hypothetical protein